MINHIRHSGKSARAGLFLGVLLILLAPGAADSFMGPLHVRNSFPLVQAVGNPSLVSARVEDSVGFHFSYSSIFVNQSSAGWDFVADAEAAMLDMHFRKTLGDAWEISLEVPAISYHGGFMDDMINSYHSAFGFPDYGRSARPLNDFLYRVERNGAVLVEGNDGRVSLGDVKLGLKNAIYAKDPYISVYAFVEFPTGDASSGFGSGGFDGGLALLVDKSVGRRLMLYLAAGAVFTDKFEAAQPVGLRSFPYAGAGLEWSVSDRASLDVQFFAQDSPFKDTGIRALDAVSTTVSLGGKFRAGSNSILELSFTEDTNTAGAPDFTFTAGYTYKY